MSALLDDDTSSMESMSESNVTYEEDDWSTELPATDWLTETYSMTNVIQIPKDDPPSVIVTDDDACEILPGQTSVTGELSYLSPSKQSSVTGRTCATKSYVQKLLTCSDKSPRKSSFTISSNINNGVVLNGEVSRRTLNKKKNPVKRKLLKQIIGVDIKNNYENTPPILQKEITDVASNVLICPSGNVPLNRISSEMMDDPLWIGPAHNQQSDITTPVIQENLSMDTGNDIEYFILYS